MPSLIQGYEYDIFISYRQKDNKGDNWVSKFVESLKTELESTFKEDISVFFDENPHDRLQETHNVDKSLEGKLKCLIFIPILSQTYCDPSSYAWQYEFLAFNKLAKEDNFGRDIRLRSGNVASRILPVRIHDLEKEDIKLFEKETGSVLRSLDFVFKTSTGVSRPLKVNEDHPNDNLNKTYYSDQINKVGHAIKEIILGMKREPAKVAEEKVQPGELPKEIREDEQKVEKEKWTKTGKIKFIMAITVLALLIAAGIIALPKLFKQNTIESLKSTDEKISIAVMPFQNMTNDTTWNIWQDGLKNELITFLSTYPGQLEVRQTESVDALFQSEGLTRYASVTPSMARIISKKLNARVLVTGSIKRNVEKIRINAQLTNSNTGVTFKSFEIDGSAKEEMIFPIIDSLKKLISNFLIISVLEKEVPQERRPPISTYSSEAYRYYMYGNLDFYKGDYPTAREWFMKAIDIDSNFLSPLQLLITSYSNQGLHEEARKWVLRVNKKSDQLTMSQKIRINALYAQYFETPYERIKYLKQCIAIDDQTPIPYHSLGIAYNNLSLYEQAIQEFETQLEIYKKWNSKPRFVYCYTFLGFAYHQLGLFKKERKLYKKAERDFPNNPQLIRRQAILSLTEGKTKSANEYIEEVKSIQRDEMTSEADIALNIASTYAEAEILHNAEEYYRQSLSLDSDNSVVMNALAYFLIDKDRNINEGMELIETALKLSPDNSNYLHTKGWGLYKQGKYQEAKDILQKSWDIRMQKAIYNHEAFLHLEAAKKAVAMQK